MKSIIGQGPFSGSNTGTTLATLLVCFSALAAEKARALLQYINVTSDKASSVIKFYTAADPVSPTATAAVAQKDVEVPDGTAFSGGDIVVIRKTSTGELQRAVVDSVADDTVTMVANLGFAIGTDDELFIMTAAGTIPVGAATKELIAAPGFLRAGEVDKPLLVDLDGTSACSINAASGIYV